jgi:hypothetical protein
MKWGIFARRFWGILAAIDNSDGRIETIPMTK